MWKWSMFGDSHPSLMLMHLWNKLATGRSTGENIYRCMNFDYVHGGNPGKKVNTKKAVRFESLATILLPYHTVHGVLVARILEWFAIPSSSGPRFVKTLHCDPSWVALHSMAYSFTELCKPLCHQIHEGAWFIYRLHSEGQRSLACCSPWGHKESDIA